MNETSFYSPTKKAIITFNNKIAGVGGEEPYVGISTDHGSIREHES
jgi:hypothetical protein